ncbi:hypothetical protein A9Q81_07105 [Gammaproteobacteria bacterium 42_54_T18]|nr:hypothetical protein A9Q81_07105 [Gammaproteobacteria bacterium 42_54_T18]
MLSHLTRLYTLFIFILCFTIHSSLIAKVLPLNDNTTFVDAGTYISYFEDIESKYTINDIQTPANERQFIQANQNLSKGYTNSTYWIRLDLHYTKGSHTQTAPPPSHPRDIIPSNLWFLDISYPLLDNVDIFIINAVDSITHIDLGDSKPFDHRSIPSPSWLTPIQVPANEILSVYIKVKSTSSFQIPISIRSPSNTATFYQNFQIGYGIYFGIIISFFLYNLFMYLFFLDRSYLYYLGYIGSFALALASIMGFGYRYLWPDTPSLTVYAIVESIALYCLFSLLFTQSFLHTKRHTPKLHKSIVVLTFICIGILIANLFVPYQVGVKFVAALTLAVNAVILITGFRSLYLGVKVAKYFVLAWTTVLIGGGLFALMSNGIIPSNLFTRFAAQIGSAIEVILLSIALADRMHRLESEKKALEQKNKNALEKANIELSSALDNVKRSNRLKDSFLATISHELRTPMNGVEGAIELAKDEKSPQKSHELLDVAASSAKKMTSLVDSILEYSELQADKTKIHPQDIALGDFLKELTTPFNNTSNAKGIEFSYVIDDNIAPTIHVDDRALSIVLAQLLDNAVKFTHVGSIRLHASLEPTTNSINTENKLVFNIIDTGIGIPSEASNEIFKPFRQADDSNARGYGGLGIGLAIGKSLASKMKGHLSAAPAGKDGTQFSLSIPYHPIKLRKAGKEEKTIGTFPLPKQENSLPTHPILVVEDNPVNQQILVKILTKLSHSTLTANNGKEALALLENETVKLIFMGCQMPEMDGYEATTKIRQSEKLGQHLPIVAVTANAMSEDRIHCLKVGMNDYIKKPINKAIISEKLKEWLP